MLHFFERKNGLKPTNEAPGIKGKAPDPIKPN